MPHPKLFCLGLPEWLKPEPGFCFLDEGDDLNIVLGWGGYRETNSMGSFQLNLPDKDLNISEALFGIEFKKPTLVIAYKYKDEWHLRSAETKESWEGCRPITSKRASKYALGFKGFENLTNED